jgi:4-diphosphocytidyl-2-C-methyl-D-erythritol kinase
MARAPAKVNLWLNVVGKRAEGYHLLDSLVAFADLTDTLEAVPASGLSLMIEGPQAGSLGDEPDNLVLKAARALAARTGVAPRASLRLTKNIPIAAGLGGGSADAAAALRALIDLWRVAQPIEELFDLAATLGADVPMCLAGRPSIASGIGDRLTPAPALPPCGLLLVNPGVALPTRDVFARRQGGFSEAVPIDRPWSTLADLVAALKRRGNDLTDAAISLQPAVGDVLETLGRSSGVRYAAMSGSGATCFALFDDLPAARRAADAMPVVWWRHAGTFAS